MLENGLDESALRDMFWAETYRYAESWYKKNYGEPERGLRGYSSLGVIWFRDVLYEVETPLSIERGCYESTLSVSFLAQCMCDEDPMEWVIGLPDIAKLPSNEISEVACQVMEVSDLTRGINVSLMTDYPDTVCEQMAFQILPHFEKVIHDLFSHDRSRLGLAVWELALVVEKAIKLLIRQSDSESPKRIRTHDLHELNRRAGKIIPSEILSQLPPHYDAIRYRYGELPPPSIQEVFGWYMAALRATYCCTCSLKGKFQLGESTVHLKVPPWQRNDLKYELAAPFWASDLDDSKE